MGSNFHSFIQAEPYFWVVELPGYHLLCPIVASFACSRPQLSEYRPAIMERCAYVGQVTQHCRTRGKALGATTTYASIELVSQGCLSTSASHGLTADPGCESFVLWAVCQIGILNVGSRALKASRSGRHALPFPHDHDNPG